MKSRMVISSAVASVHKEAAFISEMVTQGLMFESVIILKIKDNWCSIKMNDGYEGWIHQFYLSESQVEASKSLILTDRYIPLCSQRGRDARIIALLSFCTVVPVIEKASGYCKIQMINGKEGFIRAQDDIVSTSREDIIRLAKSQLGVPYLWGGKSSFGYDCSGFVQMVLKAVGISVHRDASQLADAENLEKITVDDAEPGDLVFFSENGCINHIAFNAGEGKIIHCSGEVKLESIIEGEPGFNNTLAQLDYTFTSISKMIHS